MKKYMVVVKFEDGQNAAFFDKLTDAEQYRMDAECGIGGLAEVYEYKEETETEVGGYEFLYS